MLRITNGGLKKFRRIFSKCSKTVTIATMIHIIIRALESRVKWEYLCKWIGVVRQLSRMLKASKVGKSAKAFSQAIIELWSYRLSTEFISEKKSIIFHINYLSSNSDRISSTSLNNHNYSQRVNFSFPIPSSGSNDNPDNEGQGKKSE